MSVRVFNQIGTPIDDTYEASTATKEVEVSVWGGSPKTLSADVFGGIAYFRYNGYLKNFFENVRERIQEDEPRIMYDHNISIKANIEGKDCWIERGIAEGKHIRTRQEPIIYFREDESEYPLDIVVEVSEIGNITLSGETYEPIVFSADEDMVAVFNMNGYEELDYRYGRPPRIQREHIDVGFKRAPEHPFYVRWINELGGYDYCMFVCDHKHTKKLDSISTIERYGEEGYRHLYKHEASEQITTSTGIITKEEAENIAFILYSPEVCVLNEEIGEWEEIQPAKGSKVEWMSSQPTGEIVLTFDIKKPTMI